MHWCPTPCGGQVAAGGNAPEGGGECLTCGRLFGSAAALQEAGGTSAMICGGRGLGKPPQRCEYCTRGMVALCDEPIGGGRTCDRRMCAAHRSSVGRNRDRCPDHMRQMKLVP